MIDFPRPKTGIARRIPLWPETVDAIREALAVRPTPKNESDVDLVFVTKYGWSWAKDSADQTLSKEFAKLLRALKIAGRRGLGFYALRHTFRTIADEAKDQPAADYVMGHESGHMSRHYRETISDERLKAVSDHVRKWLFNENVPTNTTDTTRKCLGSETSEREGGPQMMRAMELQMAIGTDLAAVLKSAFATVLTQKTATGNVQDDDIMRDGTVSLAGLKSEFGITRSLAYELMDSGQLAYSTCGQKRLIPRRAVKMLLNSALVGGGGLCSS